ncbi:MAG TPA: hypothetical protein VNM48_23055, partial [Chloroflexota bacterium]|nr:hypothetical protein [Chloroflexota bacterium]
AAPDDTPVTNDHATATDGKVSKEDEAATRSRAVGPVPPTIGSHLQWRSATWAVLHASQYAGLAGLDYIAITTSSQEQARGAKNVS